MQTEKTRNKNYMFNNDSRSLESAHCPKNVQRYVTSSTHNINDNHLSAHDLICNKKESEKTIKFITSKASLKTLEPTESFNNTTDILKCKNETIEMSEIDDQIEKRREETESVINKIVADVKEKPKVIFNVDYHKRHLVKRQKLIARKNIKDLEFKHTNNRIIKNHKKSRRNEVINKKIDKLNKESRSKVLVKEKFIDDYILPCEKFAMNLLNDNLSSRVKKTKTPFYATKNMPRFNKKISVENCIPYKMELINAAVAITYHESKESNITDINTNNDMILFRESLTSTETTAFPSLTILTSKPYSSELFNDKDSVERFIKAHKSIHKSNDTLVNIDAMKKSSIQGLSDHDTFFIARTSSDFRRSSLSSNYTLTSNSKCDISDYSTQHKIFNTIINLEESIPSTSSAVKYDKKLNDVVVIQPLATYFSNRNKGDDGFVNNRNNLDINILKKPVEIEKDLAHIRTVNLPNEAAIKVKYNDNDRNRIKFDFEDAKNCHPTNFSDMWVKFIEVLDKTIKELEEALAEKISKELKRLVDILAQYKRQNIPVSEKTGDERIDTKIKTSKSDKEVSVDGNLFEADKCFQCSLTENSLIDKLTDNISIEKFKKSSEKDKYLKYYLDILTMPVLDSCENKINAIPTSTATFRVEEDVQSFCWWKKFFKVPVSFVRENAFVISSVPTFFAVLLFVYGLILLVI